MEDNEKRSSSRLAGEGERVSLPETDQASGASGRGSKPPAGESEMFDPHEATLPRFTIDPGETFPARPRTRTLLGVPTQASEDAAHSDSAPPSPPADAQQGEGVSASAPATPAEQDAHDGRDGRDGHEALDITVELADYDSSDVTFVSDADILALADSTGQHAPVRDLASLDTLPKAPAPPAPADSSPSVEAVAAAAAVSGAPTAAASAAPTARAVESATSVPAAARGEPRSEPSVAPAALNSLSPREISRLQPSSNANSQESGARGALLVAAVMLLATGVWYVTSGTFQRANYDSVPAPQPTAAVTQPVAPPSNSTATGMDKAVEANPANQANPAMAAAPTNGTTTTDTNAAIAAAPVEAAPRAAVGAAPSSIGSGATRPALDSAAPGPGLKNKPSLTATVRSDRPASTRKATRRDAKAVAPAPADAGPLGPSRPEVIARLESVRPAVRACAAGRSGVADLDISIAHTGLVTHVLVGGDFAGTTEGSCIARAVRGARFPAFKQERFRILYPYAL